MYDETAATQGCTGHAPDHGSQAIRDMSVMPYSSFNLRCTSGSALATSSAKKQSSGCARACTP